MHLSKYKNSFLVTIISILLSCKGEDGAIGPIGLSSLINVTNEAVGTNCENGGIKIDVGIDNNSNGTLDADEIQSTSYICNGLDGSIGLTSVTSEPAGTNCENGGLKIESGFDNNGNGTLDVDEIVSTAYICNGIDGKVSLVNISDEVAGSNCSNGGIKIESGIDDDGDGTLGTDEIDITRYICNGVDGGFDEQIRLTIHDAGTNQQGASSSTTGFRFGEGLIKFDITSWIGVDSVVFIPNIRTSDGSVNAFAELYDGTNNSTISETTVSTNSTSYVRLESDNIYESLPQEQIDLFMQFRIEDASANAWTTGKSFLFLYRSN